MNILDRIRKVYRPTPAEKPPLGEMVRCTSCGHGMPPRYGGSFCLRKKCLGRYERKDRRP